MMSRPLLFVLSLACIHPLINAKRAHFTIEFVPTYQNDRTKCNNEEVSIIDTILVDAIQKDTGFRNPTYRKYDGLVSYRLSVLTTNCLLHDSR